MTPPYVKPTPHPPGTCMSKELIRRFFACGIAFQASIESNPQDPCKFIKDFENCIENASEGTSCKADMSLSSQLITYKRLLEEEYGVDCRMHGPSVLSRRTASGSNTGDYLYESYQGRNRQSAAEHRRRKDRDTDESYDYGETQRRHASNNVAPRYKGNYKGRENYDYYNDPAKAVPTAPGSPPNVEYEDDDAKEYYDFKPDKKRGEPGGADSGKGARGRDHKNAAISPREVDENQSRRKRLAGAGRVDGAEIAKPGKTVKDSPVYPSFEDEEGPARPGSSYEYGFEEGFSKKENQPEERESGDDIFEDDDQNGEGVPRNLGRRHRQDSPEAGPGHPEDAADDDDEDDTERMNSGLGALMDL
ncbi:hypothetical protein IscW_ISCW001339 [Ixodes scapularis]|uniref:Uncharacterized protein n=1 Tax=Ixodes scapularis TaxID=6945 RepID=B7P5N8_IXOSC|nr:hypothetical protein IscW_ISCW001339 [Ixodes scapularis]|eukprot:XP_002407776.1 hypothetical protein IscW_ISCW001339 [Ixodes scapularis]